MKFIFIVIAGILAYLLLKLGLYLYRPFYLTRIFREIEQIHNRLLTAADKDVSSAFENFEKWQSGDKSTRIVYSEDQIMESINIAKTVKAHEEEVYGKFLRLRERFVKNPNKLSESIIVYRRYLEVRLKQRDFARLVSLELDGISVDEIIAYANKANIVLEENERKLDILLS